MFSPTPWHFDEVGICGRTKEPFGEIIGADGSCVAEGVFKKDADAIIKAVNSGRSAAVCESSKEQP